MSFNVSVPIQLTQDISKHNMIISGHSQLMDISVTNIDISGNLIIKNIEIYQKLIDLSNNRDNIPIDIEISGDLSVTKNTIINENLDVSNILYVNNLDIYQKVIDLSSIIIDSVLSSSSNNAISNSAITNELSKKQNVISSTSNISLNRLDIDNSLIIKNLDIYQKVIDLSNTMMDSVLSSSSNNRVSNSVITSEILNKQNVISSISDISVNNLIVDNSLIIKNLDIYQKMIKLSNNSIGDNTLNTESDNYLTNNVVTNQLLAKQNVIDSTSNISLNNLGVSNTLHINNLNIYDKIIDLSNNGTIVTSENEIIDSVLSNSSNKPLSNSIITNALINKQNIITSITDISVNNLFIDNSLIIQNIDMNKKINNILEIEEKIEEQELFVDNVFSNGTEITGNLIIHNDLIINNLNIYQKLIDLSNDEIIYDDISFNNLDISDILYVNNLNVYDKIIELSNNNIIDSYLNISSNNAVSNSVITSELSNKQDIIISTTDISVNNLNINNNLIVQNLNIYDKVIDLSNKVIIIDDTLDNLSNKTITNSAITNELSNKQDIISSITDISLNNLDVNNNLIIQNLNVYDKIIELSNNNIIDSVLNNSSNNAVSNSAITNELSNKQDIINSTSNIILNNLDVYGELKIDNLNIYDKIIDLCDSLIITIDTQNYVNRYSDNTTRNSVITSELSDKLDILDENSHYYFYDIIFAVSVSCDKIYTGFIGTSSSTFPLFLLHEISQNIYELSQNIYEISNNIPPIVTYSLKELIFYAYNDTDYTLDDSVGVEHYFNIISLSNEDLYSTTDYKKFTVKYSGYYKIEYNIHIKNLGLTEDNATIKSIYLKNDNIDQQQYSSSFVQKDQNASNLWITNGGSYIVDLSANDYIKIKSYIEKHVSKTNSNTGNEFYNHLFGYEFKQEVGSNIMITYLG